MTIARHFPTIENVSSMASFRHSSGPGHGLAAPNETPTRAEDCPFALLHYSARLEWPEEECADPCALTRKFSLTNSNEIRDRTKGTGSLVGPVRSSWSSE